MSSVVLTGLPGVGKTTLIKRLAEDLQKNSFNFTGFYTEEVRDHSNNKRIGFDIVTFDSSRGKLARIGETKTTSNSEFKVGHYNVFIKDFEQIMAPVFSSKSKLIIIDEIGTMELFSNEFEIQMNRILSESNRNLIATVPLVNKRKNKLLETIKSDNVKFIHLEVTKENRNYIYPTFYENCLKILN